MSCSHARHPLGVIMGLQAGGFRSQTSACMPAEMKLYSPTLGNLTYSPELYTPPVKQAISRRYPCLQDEDGSVIVRGRSGRSWREQTSLGAFTLRHRTARNDLGTTLLLRVETVGTSPAAPGEERRGCRLLRVPLGYFAEGVGPSKGRPTGMHQSSHFRVS